MCGRMNISDHEGVQWLLKQVGLSLDAEKFTPRFNIAPTTAVWGITIDRATTGLHPMQWGFVPPWAKEGQFKRPLFNARGETIWEKPSFRSLIPRYRGILPANGFYEWQRKGKLKTAFHITATDAPALAFGCIIQMHNDGYFQCCIVTTEAQGDMRRIHNRQPVIIEPDQIERWLHAVKPDEINSLIKPADPGRLMFTAVGDYVNSSRNEGPRCLESNDQPPVA